MRAFRIGTAALLVTALGCGEPTGPDALETSTFQGDLTGSLERSLSGEASVDETAAEFPEDITQDVWLLSLTAYRPGGRTEINIVGGTDSPREKSYEIVPFAPPLSVNVAFAALWVFEGDSVTDQYLAEGGDVTMTRVTSREAYGTFSFDALGGDRDRDSLEVTASGSFRGYH